MAEDKLRKMIQEELPEIILKTAFEGIKEYKPDCTSKEGYKYSLENYTIALADSDDSHMDEAFREEYLVEEIEGKSEAFLPIQGEGVL